MTQPSCFLLVIGGGAAGVFAAVNAARLHPGKRILLLEKSAKLLSKVRISGGGRCNVTHACFDPKNLLQYYPRGKKELAGPFSRFNANHTVEWFESRGVKLKTEADGRMFPVSDRSEEIIECLLSEAKKHGVEIKIQSGIQSLEFFPSCIRVIAEGGGEITAENVLIATGGAPQIKHYQWLQQSIFPPVPSLFTFNLKPHPLKEFMGLSVQDAEVSINGFKEKSRGPLLITHWGLSGPAVLKLSSLAAPYLHELNYRFDIVVNWLPEYKPKDLEEKLQEKKYAKARFPIFHNKAFQEIPNRLWEHFCRESEMLESMNWADIPGKKLNRLAGLLSASNFRAEGKTTFKEEFVTCGGIDLKDVDLKTMESKTHPRLFFAGEVLNIDGITGGFNFQAAWTSAFIAASSLHKD